MFLVLAASFIFLLSTQQVLILGQLIEVEVSSSLIPDAIYMSCDLDQGEWVCVEITTSEYENKTYRYYCENSFVEFYKSVIQQHCEFTPTEAESVLGLWKCPNIRINNFFKHNCELYNPSLESVGAEPLTMTSAASGSVVLTTEFSTKCPIEKLCFNQRLKACCSLVKIGRQWRCPKFCFQTRRS